MLQTFEAFSNSSSFIEYSFGTDTKNPLNFYADETLHAMLMDRTPAGVKALNRFLKININKTVVMYHGTSAEHPIMEVGLRRTTGKTKKSIQSATGFVYLSLYESMAETFGSMAYSGRPVGINVYRVLVPVKHLKPDADQLFNKRMWSDDVDGAIGGTLADSFIWGSGARVKGDIPPYMISLSKEVPPPKLSM